VETKVIGIAGVARVGKDTFAAHIGKVLEKQGLVSQRVAFADVLKKDINSFLLAKSGVNAYTIDEEEKHLLRPLMVEYGRLMRALSDGEYWIKQIAQRVEKNIENNIISLITDVRYQNEASWINSLDGGISLHLFREGINPANEEEALNDPLTQKECSYSINWETVSSQKDIGKQAANYIHGLELLTEPLRPGTSFSYSNTKQ
jgi:hypothetical protein